MQTKSTGRWVSVRSGEYLEDCSTRMLHVDIRGREVIRLNRQWWLVERNVESGFRNTYKIVGRA